jgi:hypothetical protein
MLISSILPMGDLKAELHVLEYIEKRLEPICISPPPENLYDHQVLSQNHSSTQQNICKY